MSPVKSISSEAAQLGSAESKKFRFEKDDTVYEGEGNTFLLGGMDSVPQMEGDTVPQGDGEAVCEGKGETVTQGDGEVVGVGERETVSPDGEVVLQGRVVFNL